MSLEPGVLLTPCTISTPSSALATNLPYQQSSLFLQLPYDMLSCIVDYLCYSDGTPDYETLGALAITNSALLDMCRRKQFHAIAFNMRRIDMPDRAKSFVNLLDDNTNLQQYVQAVFFGDNVFYPSLIRDTEVVSLGELQDRQQYYSHSEMAKDDMKSLLYGPKNDHDFVCEALKKLKCLTFVELSFLYTDLDWESTSLILREGLSNLLLQPNLRSLHIRGLGDIPIELLERFRSLEELYLSASTIMPRNCSEISAPALTTLPPIYTSAAKHRLKVISLNNIGRYGMQPLLDHWRNQSNEPGFVDMSSPAQIDLAFDGLDSESVNLRQLIGDTAFFVKSLLLDTSEISFTIDVPLSSEEEEEEYLEHYNNYDSFKQYLPALNDRLNDVTSLDDLESLELHIIYWERGIDTAEPDFRPDEELQWALKLLQHVPSEYIKEIILNIKVGGYSAEFQDAFTNFNSDQEFIWNDWAKEFRLPKYRTLQKLTVRIFGLETFDSDDTCPSLHQKIVDRTLEKLYPALKKSVGCYFYVQCYVTQIQCLIY